MQIDSVISLIRESVLLSAAERMYWLQLIPSMTPEQVQRLAAILGGVEKLRWKEKIGQFVTLITHSLTAGMLKPMG